MLVNVENGTDAGRRRVVELSWWFCRCTVYLGTLPITNGRQHPGTRYSCPDCGARRPERNRR